MLTTDDQFMQPLKYTFYVACLGLLAAVGILGVCFFRNIHQLLKNPLPTQPTLVNHEARYYIR